MIARNIVANWFWYAFVVVAGFLLPRFIDQHQGRDLLGIWDFGWALVSYIALPSKLGSAVNRYVARYRAVADWNALNAAVNSSLVLLVASSVVGLMVAAALALLTPSFLEEASTQTIAVARTLVLVLCFSAALQLPGSVFNAVITGYQRYDCLNLIRGARDCLVLVVSISLLFSGYGIVALACTVLCAEVVSDLAKFLTARRLCPQLTISAAYCRWPVLKEMCAFGAKTLVQAQARAGLYGINTILVLGYLGPGTLAIYTRQRALVLHMMKIVKQYAQVFQPASSSLDAQAKTGALQRMLVQSSIWGMFVTLPGVLVLVIMGGPLLRFWMGAGYEAPLVLAILALGHLPVVPQLGVYAVLTGLGRHGYPAIFDLIAAVLSVILGIVTIGVLHGGMVGAAIAVVAPVTLSGGVLVPLYACRILEVRASDYFRQILLRPVLTAIPFGCCLVLARYFLADSTFWMLAGGLGVGGPITACVYWRWVLPPSLRTKLKGRLVALFRKRPANRTEAVEHAAYDEGVTCAAAATTSEDD